jgi:DNA polymerase III subunit gamma/tau
VTVAMNPMAVVQVPQTFSDIVGQDLILTALRSRLGANQKLDCHLTFAGPPGAGKRAVALLYAQSLVCDARLSDGSPCQACAECLAIRRGSSFAYVEIDAATQGDDETVRTLLERDALLNTASVRVVVINNAERLTMPGADAALKTLERETKSVFLFLVNDLSIFAGALRSRCHAFHVRPVDEAPLVGHLAHVCDQSQIAYERPALRTIVQESQRLAGRAVATLMDVASRGAVSVANVRAFMGLGWGVTCCVAGSRCWPIDLTIASTHFNG